MIGLTFHKLTVISAAASSKGRRRWTCRCECGKETEVSAQNLRLNRTRSCGCLVKLNGVIHGHRYSLTYSSWRAMHQRCNNPKHKAYPDYGGRGITICERWKVFENFLEDMGERREKGLSLDRIKVNENYCKENCRWATRSQQNRNKRKKLTF